MQISSHPFSYHHQKVSSRLGFSSQDAFSRRVFVERPEHELDTAQLIKSAVATKSVTALSSLFVSATQEGDKLNLACALQRCAKDNTKAKKVLDKYQDEINQILNKKLLQLQDQKPTKKESNNLPYQQWLMETTANIGGPQLLPVVLSMMLNSTEPINILATKCFVAMSKRFPRSAYMFISERLNTHLEQQESQHTEDPKR